MINILETDHRGNEKVRDYKDLERSLIEIENSNADHLRKIDIPEQSISIDEMEKDLEKYKMKMIDSLKVPLEYLEYDNNSTARKPESKLLSQEDRRFLDKLNDWLGWRKR